MEQNWKVLGLRIIRRRKNEEDAGNLQHLETEMDPQPLCSEEVLEEAGVS